MKHDFWNFINDEKTAPLKNYEQLSFLTKENCPNIQANQMYERSIALYESFPDDDCRRLVEDIAMQLEFNMRTNGTDYFLYTLLYLHSHNYSIRQAKYAFYKISQIDGITVSLVKKRIINSLNSMDKLAKKEVIQKYFPEHDGRHPSLMYSIDLALMKLNRKYSQHN